MIPQASLKDLLARSEYSQKDKLLLCLGVEPLKPRAVAELRDLATGAGLRKAADWNISALLQSSSGFAVRTTSGWELTTPGLNRISELAGPLGKASVPHVASSLRQLLGVLTNVDTKAFVLEAIECFEARQFRAAVVLSWVGAVSVLHTLILSSYLTAFNAEAFKRDAKWKPAKSSDDLSRLREKDFLEILQAVSAIGKNVKQELDKALTLRNGCGHPNSLKIGESTVAAHIELLVLNVFQPFAT